MTHAKNQEARGGQGWVLQGGLSKVYLEEQAVQDRSSWGRFREMFTLLQELSKGRVVSAWVYVFVQGVLCIMELFRISM